MLLRRETPRGHECEVRTFGRHTNGVGVDVGDEWIARTPLAWRLNVSPHPTLKLGTALSLAPELLDELLHVGWQRHREVDLVLRDRMNEPEFRRVQ